MLWIYLNNQYIIDMPRKSSPHPYSENKAFERLLLLIATILKYPGVGSSDNVENLRNLGNNKKDQDHSALTEVGTGLRELAALYKVEFPNNSPANPTLRKDLEILRRYGILDKLKRSCRGKCQPLEIGKSK
jgi:hypothetical protein